MTYWRATFDNQKQEEAIAKRHSTIDEAFDVFKRMNAFRLILTHFSQRYPGMPPIDDPIHFNALYAFDYMTFRLPDLLWVNKLTEPLLCLFPPESGDIDPTSENDTTNHYPLQGSINININTSSTTRTCRCNLKMNTNTTTTTATTATEEDLGDHDRQRLVLKRKINSTSSNSSDVSSAFCNLCSEF